MIFSRLVSFWTRAHVNQHIASNKFLYSKHNNKHSNFNKESSNNGSLKYSRSNDEHAKDNLRSGPKKVVLVKIATIKLWVKGPSWNDRQRIGMQTRSSKWIDIRNMAVMLSWYWRRRKTKSQNEKQIKNQIMSRLYSSGLYYILVGHISDALVEILFRLMKAWKIYSTKAIVYKNHRAAPEWKWVHGGGIKIPCNYELLDRKSIKTLLKRKEKTVNVYHFTLLWLFLPFNPFMTKWAYLRGRDTHNSIGVRMLENADQNNFEYG